jgi:hypothetical protein
VLVVAAEQTFQHLFVLALDRQQLQLSDALRATKEHE